MAIFGSFPAVREQLAADSRFTPVWPYVAAILTPGSPEQRRLAALTAGASVRHELGGGCFALEQVVETGPRAGGVFESHRRYIDVQVVEGGVEAMEVAETGDLAVSRDYDAEHDYLKYALPAAASVLRVGAGAVAVFFPVDGHMPGRQAAGVPGTVRKTVVKVPVA